MRKIRLYFQLKYMKFRRDRIYRKLDKLGFIDKNRNIIICDKSEPLFLKLLKYTPRKWKELEPSDIREVMFGWKKE